PSPRENGHGNDVPFVSPVAVETAHPPASISLCSLRPRVLRPTYGCDIGPDLNRLQPLPNWHCIGTAQPHGQCEPQSRSSWPCLCGVSPSTPPMSCFQL